MSNTFRVKEKEYKPFPVGRVTLDYATKIKKKAKELEIARAEGKFAQYANTVASRLPRGAYKIVEDFLRAKGLKIYGGTALNAYLPRKKRIYKPTTLPDYDFFSPTPWLDAVELSNILYHAGYKYTEAKSGIHKGTYKVFVDFWPVADITYLPPDMYKKVTTNKIKGLSMVSPAYLQKTLYTIASKPLEVPVRWPNVAFRQRLLDRWAPPKFRTKQCGEDFIGVEDRIEIDPTLSDALEIVNREARLAKLLHGGAIAYNKYVEIGGGDLRLPVYFYELYAEDATAFLTRLRDELSEIGELTSEIFYRAFKDMNNTTHVLYLISEGERMPIVTVTELTRCIPYKYIGGRYYCAIDYLFYELYSQMFGESMELYSRDVSCLIRYLFYIQQRYYKETEISELDTSPLQRFVTKCMGPFVDVVREEFYSRWLDRAEARSKITDIVPKDDTYTLKGVRGRKVRVYPKEMVQDTECGELSHDACKYPCTWTEEIDRCTTIPFSGYAPGMKKTESPNAVSAENKEHV
jgi:hypothetical protein